MYYDRILKFIGWVVVFFIVLFIILCVAIWNNGGAPSNYLGTANRDHSAHTEQLRQATEARLAKRGW